MAELIFQKNNIGIGKRKQAIARVFLIPGEGNLIINKVSGNQYLQEAERQGPRQVRYLNRREASGNA